MIKIDIKIGKSMKIHGVSRNDGEVIDKTFQVGDTCQIKGFSRYNGTIKYIAPMAVVIADDAGDIIGRFNMKKFCSAYIVSVTLWKDRNKMVAVDAFNAEEAMHI